MRASVFPPPKLCSSPRRRFRAEGDPLLLSASRSGERTETVKAVEAFAQRFPGRTVLIGCKPGSTLDRIADISIMIPEGYGRRDPADAIVHLDVPGRPVPSVPARPRCETCRRTKGRPARRAAGPSDSLELRSTPDRRVGLGVHRVRGGGPALRCGHGSHPQAHRDVVILGRLLPYPGGAPRPAQRHRREHPGRKPGLETRQKTRKPGSDGKWAGTLILPSSRSHRTGSKISVRTCPASRSAATSRSTPSACSTCRSCNSWPHHPAVHMGVDPDESRNLTSYIELPEG